MLGTQQRVKLARPRQNSQARKDKQGREAGALTTLQTGAEEAATAGRTGKAGSQVAGFRAERTGNVGIQAEGTAPERVWR